MVDRFTVDVVALHSLTPRRFDEVEAEVLAIASSAEHLPLRLAEEEDEDLPPPGLSPATEISEKTSSNKPPSPRRAPRLAELLARSSSTVTDPSPITQDGPAPPGIMLDVVTPTQPHSREYYEKKKTRKPHPFVPATGDKVYPRGVMMQARFLESLGFEVCMDGIEFDTMDYFEVSGSIGSKEGTSVGDGCKGAFAVGCLLWGDHVQRMIRVPYFAKLMWIWVGGI